MGVGACTVVVVVIMVVMVNGGHDKGKDMKARVRVRDK